MKKKKVNTIENLETDHSSRIARPKLVARAALTELRACGGSPTSTKSGRSFATVDSCNLFNSKLH